MPVTPSKIPKIGIVVLTYNCIDFTRKCLETLKVITYLNYQVVVVDNNSQDGSKEIIPSEFKDVIFLPQSVNRGFTGGNNIGISWCLKRDYDAILLINNDTIVKPDFLTLMVKHLNDETMVTPQILSYKKPDRFGSYMGEFDWIRGVWKNNICGKKSSSLCQTPKKIEMASACCLLVPRKIFESIGLFDDNYFLYFEDIDFINRAKLSNFDLFYEPCSIIYHNERTSTSEYLITPETLYYNTRNRLYFMKKNNRNKYKQYIFITYFIFTRLIFSTYYCITGNKLLLRAMLKAINDYRAKKMNCLRHSL